MKNHILNCIWILLIVVQGCAYPVSQIKTSTGIVKIGMTKADVLSVWGHPHHKWYDKQDVNSNEWNYPNKYWWGGRITLWFDEKGTVKEIEIVQD